MSRFVKHFATVVVSIGKLAALPLFLLTLSDFFPVTRQDTLTSVIAIILITCGFLGMAVSSLIMFRFGEGGLHFVRAPKRLVQVGLYARNRHPNFWFFMLYLAGWFILLLGITWLALLLMLGTVLSGLVYLLWVQEKNMTRTLGDVYKIYRKNTPLLHWKIRLPEDLRVRWLAQLIWLIGRSVFRYWYNIRITGSEYIPLKKPFLVIANHESFLDPFLFGTFIPFELRFVTTADVFTSAWMRFLLKGIGTFPMRRHKQDLTSIRTMIRMVKQDQVVGIFPEGGRSLYGAPLPILKETLKLIQRCNVPILPIHLDGAYEIWPRWAPNRRRGEVSVTINPIIPISDQGDIARLEELITQRIFAPEKIFRSVKSSYMTRGMDDVLWACQKCFTHNSICIRSRDVIECSHCGASWKALGNYSFIDMASAKSTNMIEWMQTIEAEMLERAPTLSAPVNLLPGERLYLCSPINRYDSEDNQTASGDLSLFLSDQRMLLIRGEALWREWAMDAITVFTMDYYNAVSIGVGGIRHSFNLPESEVSLKWQTFFDTLKLARIA